MDKVFENEIEALRYGLENKKRFDFDTMDISKYDDGGYVTLTGNEPLNFKVGGALDHTHYRHAFRPSKFLGAYIVVEIFRALNEVCDFLCTDSYEELLPCLHGYDFKIKYLLCIRSYESGTDERYSIEFFGNGNGGSISFRMRPTNDRDYLLILKNKINRLIEFFEEINYFKGDDNG